MKEKSSYESIAEKLADFSQGSSSYFFSKPTDTIVTSEDRLFRILTRHQKDLESRSSWIAPLGILVTTVGTLFGVDEFKPLFGIPAGGIHGFFLFLSVACGVWLAIYYEAILSYFRTPREKLGTDQLIEKIKADSEKWQQSNERKYGGNKGLTLGTLATILGSVPDADAKDLPTPSTLPSNKQ